MKDLGDLSERWIHEVVPVLTRFTLSLMPTGRAAGEHSYLLYRCFCSKSADIKPVLSRLSMIVEVVACCVDISKKLKPAVPRPKLDALRYSSAKQWGEVENALRNKRLNSYPNWKPIVKAWDLFGKILKVDEYGSVAGVNADASPAFMLLERCGWQECLCSVHRPIHRLRVCKGCWRVAYCNAKCQSRSVSNLPLPPSILTGLVVIGTTAGTRGDVYDNQLLTSSSFVRAHGHHPGLFLGISGTPLVPL